MIYSIWTFNLIVGFIEKKISIKNCFNDVRLCSLAPSLVTEYNSYQSNCWIITIIMLISYSNFAKNGEQ